MWRHAAKVGPHARQERRGMGKVGRGGRRAAPGWVVFLIHDTPYPRSIQSTPPRRAPKVRGKPLVSTVVWRLARAMLKGVGSGAGSGVGSAHAPRGRRRRRKSHSRAPPGADRTRKSCVRKRRAQSQRVMARQVCLGSKGRTMARAPVLLTGPSSLEGACARCA